MCSLPDGKTSDRRLQGAYIQAARKLHDLPLGSPMERLWPFQKEEQEMKLPIPILAILALGVAAAQGTAPGLSQSQASVTLVRWVEVLPQVVRWEDLGAGRARQIYLVLEGLSYGFTPEEAQAAVEALQRLLPEDLLQQLDQAAARLARDENTLLYFSAADFEEALHASIAGAFTAAENGGADPGE